MRAVPRQKDVPQKLGKGPRPRIPMKRDRERDQLSAIKLAFDYANEECGDDGNLYANENGIKVK